jgi:hypothetical protein
MKKGYATSEGTPVRFYLSDVPSYREIQNGRAAEISYASVAVVRRCMETNKFHIKAGLTETGDYAKC